MAMALSDLSQCCSNKSDTVMINKNVTRLTTQGCNNTVISRLYRTCWINLVTSLIMIFLCWCNCTQVNMMLVMLLWVYIHTGQAWKICPATVGIEPIISTRLFIQIVNSLFQTCWQLGTSSANTTCWRLVGRLATRCEIFAYEIHG
jgi:hypothetical protein